jgi:hypothetical protein
VHLHRGRLVPKPPRHALSALFALVAVAGAACSSDSTSTLRPAQLRDRAGAICDRAAAAISAIAPPATFAEVAGSLTEAGRALRTPANQLPRLQPPAGVRDEFGDLVEHTDELTFHVALARDAAQAQDARLAGDELDAMARALDEIDGSARALELPRCGSAAWGRSYLEAAGSIVTAEIPIAPPITGDFVTDVNAACMRFAELFPGGPPVVPENPDEYALLLTQLRDAYDQVANELELLTPPIGAESDFDALIDSFRAAAAAVAAAPADPANFEVLSGSLGGIGGEITARSQVLGVAC